MSEIRIPSASPVVGEKSGTRWIVHPTIDMLGHKATLYESPATGLRGMHIATGEPLTNVHIVIATEADTNGWSNKDDGLPHTLEHAIFLGSELYPFKGILDKLANRSLADGTNVRCAAGVACCLSGRRRRAHVPRAHPRLPPMAHSAPLTRAGAWPPRSSRPATARRPLAPTPPSFGDGGVDE